MTRIRRASSEEGFTLIEALLVLEIIAILTAIAVPQILGAREKAKASTAMTNADAIRRASERYALDVGFYPPDVTRGWDPGFMQPLPFNPDTGDTTIPECSNCPPDWVAIVQERWKGPYLSKWPTSTPWGGKYDYNNWPLGATRYGYSVPPGIYAGVERDYQNEKGISAIGERFLLDRGLDFDGYRNGESQLRLVSLE